MDPTAQLKSSSASKKVFCFVETSESDFFFFFKRSYWAAESHQLWQRDDNQAKVQNKSLMQYHLIPTCVHFQNLINSLYSLTTWMLSHYLSLWKASQRRLALRPAFPQPLLVEPGTRHLRQSSGDSTKTSGDKIWRSMILVAVDSGRFESFQQCPVSFFVLQHISFLG